MRLVFYGGRWIWARRTTAVSEIEIKEFRGGERMGVSLHVWTGYLMQCNTTNMEDARDGRQSMDENSKGVSVVRFEALLCRQDARTKPSLHS